MDFRHRPIDSMDSCFHARIANPSYRRQLQGESCGQHGVWGRQTVEIRGSILRGITRQTRNLPRGSRVLAEFPALLQRASAE